MQTFTLTELAEATGLSRRTIRYYIAQGLVPAPGRQGAATRYPRSTSDRLRLIARMRDANAPLAAIRERLGQLGDEDVAAMVGVLSAWPDRPATPPVSSQAMPFEPVTKELDGPALGLAEVIPAYAGAPAARLLSGELHTLDTSPRLAKEPVSEPALGQRSQWERITISKDVELHVRRPLSPHDNRLVKRLLELAGRLAEATP